MSALDAFLAMGGYARFVWPAYAVAAIVVIGMTAQTVAAHRRTKRALDRAQAAREARKR